MWPMPTCCRAAVSAARFFGQQGRVILSKGNMKKTTLCYIEKDGKYLMLHRIRKKNDVNQDKWIGIGGHFEEGETPEECVLREAKEETGLTLTSFRLRGVIEFISDRWEPEAMYLFTADGFDGKLIDCNEGKLEWVEKARLIDLKLWEGDYIFLKLLDERETYFDLRLVYEGERLVKAVLDGRELELFDICDEEGEPTGQTRERSLVHCYGTPHRTSHVWIGRTGVDGTAEILLQKRSEKKDSFPGCYDISSAGHIPAGGDWVESALRELEEELGIKAAPEDLECLGDSVVSVKNLEFHGKPFHDHEISRVYLYRKPVNEAELLLQAEEVESVLWMNLEECIRAVEEHSIPNCINICELQMIKKAVGR